MYKKISASLLALAVLIMPGLASAHVVVKPAEVGIGAFQTFTTGVPNEKENAAVTELKLVMPAGLNYVAPNVKPGWQVNVVKDGDTVKEIDWTGGSIPAGQRDDFAFSAQAPEKSTTIAWKAYQTYDDGTVVAWDQKPDGKDSEDSTPYSQTKVVNDLSASAAATTKASNDNSTSNTLPVILSVVAIVLSIGSLLKRPSK